MHKTRSIEKTCRTTSSACPNSFQHFGIGDGASAKSGGFLSLALTFSHSVTTAPTPVGQAPLCVRTSCVSRSRRPSRRNASIRAKKCAFARRFTITFAPKLGPYNSHLEQDTLPAASEPKIGISALADKGRGAPSRRGPRGGSRGCAWHNQPISPRRPARVPREPEPRGGPGHRRRP